MANQSRTIAVVVVTADFGVPFERTLTSLFHALADIDRVYIICPISPLDHPNHLLTSKYIFLQDKGVGIYEAMNLMLIQEPIEDFILFLNAGDELFSRHYFEEAKSILKIYDDTVAIVSGYETRLRESRSKPISIFLGARTVLPNGNAKRIKQCSFLINSAVFKELNGFDSQYKIAADYDLFLKVSRYNKTRYLKIISSLFFLDGISSKNRVASLLDQELVENKSEQVSLGKPIRFKIDFQLRMVRAKIIDFLMKA